MARQHRWAKPNPRKRPRLRPAMLLFPCDVRAINDVYGLTLSSDPDSINVYIELPSGGFSFDVARPQVRELHAFLGQWLERAKKARSG